MGIDYAIVYPPNEKKRKNSYLPNPPVGEIYYLRKHFLAATCAKRLTI